jgi:gliding motility-associated-like protein
LPNNLYLIILMRKRLLFLLLTCFSFSVYSQDFSNKGKDFWVGYGYHSVMTQAGTNNLQNMVLYFATDQVTTVTVSIPGTGYSQTYANIPANTVFTSNPIPKAGAQDARLFSETATPQDKGIHIVADRPIVAYAHIYNQSVSGATILFPTNTLGKEYYSINYKNISNSRDANCWFYVIACDTGTTTVEVIPSANTLTHPAGVPFTVTLTQGQIYNLMGQLINNTANPYTGVDLTGSKIRSIAAAGNSCKRIAVFSGSGRISITCNNNSSSSDNYMAQAFPKSAWGKKFLTVSTGGQPNNIYRICVSDPSAAVTVNGAPVSVSLVNNFYYELPATTQPLKIESSLPITVAQYIASVGACGNPGGVGDPEVIYLSPVEQNITKVIWNATPNFLITTHYYSVVIPNTGTAISSFKLDGVAVNPALFTVHPQDPGYSYLTQNVGSMQRRIESDSGFNAIAYGFGNAESYGYNAGTNVRDLYQKVGVTSQYSIEPAPSVCTGSPFKFKISLPYLADSIRWNLSALPGAPANVVKNYSIPAVPSDADSSTVVNGKTIYWYSIPTFYNFNTIGIYPVSIVVYAANAEGCGNEQIIDFDLEITNPPVAGFNWVHNGCINQAVQFNDQSTTVKPTYKWWWDFGDPASGAANSSTLKNPVHSFSTPGTYNVRFAAITTPGCLSDTITRQIIIHPLATGNISGPSSVCQNAGTPVITFAGTTGTAPFTFIYNINNGPAQTIVTSTGNSVTLPVPTATLGTFAYHLVSVKDAGGTAGCIQNQPDTVQVQVLPVPTATISGTATVCQNAVSPVVTFTGQNTVAPYNFTYTINGGAPQTISSTGNSVTIPAPTATPGSFQYNLVSVSDGNANPCGQPQAGSVTITVNPLPTATIAGTTEVCLNANSPAVTFTGVGGIVPYIFTYSLNGGPDQTITSNGNTATIAVPTNAAGTFTYTLKSVRDAVSVLCSQSQSGSATVIVNPPPTANFNNSLPTCVNRSLSFNDISSPNAGVLNTWTWNFGDPGSSNTSALQNPTHIYSNPGTYTVTLSVTNDKGCISVPFPKTVTVGTLPKAGFTLPEVCLLDPFAQFTDTSKAVAPATITAWQWNFGDPGSGASNSSTIQNAQHSYSAVGNYNVQLIASTSSGCTDTLTQQLTVNGGNPQAAFIQLNPTSSCSSDTVSIQNKSTIASGNITKLEIYWDNTGQPTIFETDEVPVFDKVYKHKYPLSNVTRAYTVRYRAYSGGVCVNDRLQTVTVLATPDVIIGPIPDQCYSTQPLVLNYGGQNGSVAGTETYSGPGVVFAGGWQFIPSVAGIGTHTIRYKFTSTAGGCTDSTTTTVRVLDTASARFTVSVPACERSTVTFNEQSTAPTGINVTGTTWDFGDGTALQNLGVGGTVSHVYASAGTYTVTMYNTSSTGCKSAPFSRPVVVGPIPRPAFSFPAIACLPAASVSFTNLSTIADGTESSFAYLWNFGDTGSGANNTSTVKDPIHIYNGTGPFNVKLQVKSGAGCFHDTTIVVNTIHPQPKADFSFTAPAICIADNIGFLDRSTGGDGTISNWQWTFGDGNGSSQQNPTHLYATASTFNVKLYITNSFGCNSDTVTKPFTVYPYPLVDGGPEKYVLEGGSIPLTTTVTGANLSWLWEPATYLNSNTAAVPVSTPLQDISYKVTVSNPGGCSATDMVSVKILKGPNIPNTFSPNGDGVNETWIIEYLNTYPNCKVKVFTRQGQLVFESRGYRVPWDGTMKGKTLPIDTYYYIIEPENGRKPLTGYVTIVK